MQSAQNLRALLRCRTTVGRKRAPGRRDGAPRILLVCQRNARDQSPVGRTDDVRDLAAVRFDECSVDVVGRDGSDRSGGSRECGHALSRESLGIIQTDTSRSLFQSIQ